MKLFLSILTIAALLAGSWFFFLSDRGEAGVVSTARLDFTEVERGEIVQTVRATGQLSPVREVQVGSQISGNIVELLADFNSEVRKGDLIAKLDTATFEADVELAQAELRSAEAAYNLARLRKDRSSRLKERNMISQAELDEVVAELRQADSQRDIRRSALKRAELELERCFILSPTDGIVISRNVDVGQTVAASLSAPVLFEIADDLTQMEIIVNVPEADVGGLEVGQRVEFQVDAHRDRRLEGEVAQIRNAPRMIDNVVTYDTVVAVDNREMLLKPGMTAEVFIITREVDDVVRVRNSALRARLPEGLRPPVERPEGVDPEARAVFTHTDSGTVAVRWIKTGISDDLYTEVIDGVEQGERLITGFRLATDGGREGGGSLIGGQRATF